MKAARAIVLVMIALLVNSRPALGHEIAPTRSVVVQIEERQLVLLVGWRPGNGESGTTLLADATGRARGTVGAALGALLTARALAPLAVEIDGHSAAPLAVDTKLTADPPGSGQIAVVALMVFPLPAGATTALVRTRDPASGTRMSWIDRGCRVIRGAAAPRTWQRGAHPIQLSLSAAPPHPGGAPCRASLPASPSPSPSPAAPTRSSSPRPPATTRRPPSS